MNLEPVSRSYGGFELALLQGGRSGPSILFLHGEEGLRNNAAVLDELASCNTVLAPYHPGFAGPVGLKPPGSMAELVNLYLYVLRDVARAEGRPVVLLGCGFGGWLAAELAIRSPAEVAALCLVSPVGIRTRPPREREIADVFDLDVPGLRRLWFGGSGGDFLDPGKMEESDWLSFAQDREGLARYAWIPYMHDPALASGLGLIQAPTACIWNAQDAAVREGYFADLAARIPGSRAVALGGSSHFPLLTDRGACLAALETLLKSIPVARTRALAGTGV